jgi:hypothetical protein
MGFRMMARRVLRRYWMRVRPNRMKLTKASSELGERLGIDWLTYNPLVFLDYHEHPVANAPTVASTFEEVFPETKRFVDAGAGSGAYAAELRRRGHTVVAYEYTRLGRLIASFHVSMPARSTWHRSLWGSRSSPIWHIRLKSPSTCLPSSAIAL